MSQELFILLFNAAFFLNNIFYLRFIDRMFDIQSSRIKRVAFSALTGLCGTAMLLAFGSMSALGYGIMLLFYTVIVMLFYSRKSVAARMACVLSFNLHIMCTRAVVTSIASMITGESIYALSAHPESFWTLLILTALLCTVTSLMTMVLLPQKYISILVQNPTDLKLFIAIAVIGNFYMIVNGNIYIHEISYTDLPLHQILISLCWMAATYVGVFTLFAFRGAKEQRKQLEKDTIYKQVVESRSLAVLKVNCTQDKLMDATRYGKREAYIGMPYSLYSKQILKDIVYEEDYEATVEREHPDTLITEFENGKTELSYDGRIVLDGQVRWIRSLISLTQDPDSEDIIAIITVLDDIHELRTETRSLQEAAQRDSLLGLYNKKATKDYITEHLKESSQGALFMIDLDNFKSINDTFGHSFGDDVLKDVSGKIVRKFRSDDIIGRIGGDEFVVFLKNDLSHQGLEQKARQLCESIAYTYKKDGKAVAISCSIGIAVASSQERTFESLYHHADLAMYDCKKKHKNGYVFYKKHLM